VLGVYSDSPDATEVARPSSWFTWHAHRIRPGSTVLDLACGTGRILVPLLELGARVVAIDKDPARLEIAQQEARSRGVAVEWKEVDLERSWPALGKFDAVMVFNFLDRERMPRILELVAHRGLLMYETFFEAQKEFGWGPTNDAHLLKTGELFQMVKPLLVIHGREVIEPVDSSRWMALASALAQRV